MDERHWWFASKLQQTFHFSGYDNPSMLEDFLSDFEVAELITRFLGPGGPRKLFFYCEDADGDESRTPTMSNRQLQVTTHSSGDILSKAKDSVCLYVLRRTAFGEVDITQIDSEVYCGEIRHSALSSLSVLLSEAYAPLLHQQTNWGTCSNENISTFFQVFDRLRTTIQESAVQSLTQQANLQQPSSMLKEALTHFQPQHVGQMAVSSEIVADCEALMNDWIATIEGMLIEATDERYGYVIIYCSLLPWCCYVLYFEYWKL